MENKYIALFNIEGRFFAINNVCPHRGGPLAEGSLEGPVVTCPWHGWQFDVSTGTCRTAPDFTCEKFEVRLEGDEIFVGLA